MRYDDYWQYRVDNEKLTAENAKLYEQVRTLSALLAERNPAHFIIRKGGPDYIESQRPAAETAHARTFVTDELLDGTYMGPKEVLGLEMYRMHHKILELAKERGVKPVDFMWRLALERDYTCPESS